MFTFEEFEHLNSLWDGKVANAKVCASCGACCDNKTKTLFPGEAQYLYEKTGINNSLWVSSGCLCYDIKDVVKPVICKLYPTFLKVDITGYEIVKKAEPYYSNNCTKLKINYEAMTPYLDYLFSDIDNRIFYIMTFCLDELKTLVKDTFKEKGITDIGNVTERAMALALNVPYDEHDSAFGDFSYLQNIVKLPKGYAYGKSVWSRVRR